MAFTSSVKELSKEQNQKLFIIGLVVTVIAFFIFNATLLLDWEKRAEEAASRELHPDDRMVKSQVEFGTMMRFVIRAGLACVSGFLVVLVASLFMRKQKSLVTIDEYYCADCGQYFGLEPRVCDRCGSNRYKTEDDGVGRTLRNR